MACEEFRDVMLDVLYGEGDAAGRRAFESHHQQCADCRDELRALRGTRRDLREWVVPARPGAARTMGAGTARAWLPLAAAVLLGIAVGLALAGSHRRMETLTAALQEQDQRHRTEIAALRATLAAERPASEPALEDVRRLIRESEARQALVLDASLRGMAERTDALRRQDMAQVSAGLSYLEGRTGLQVARTTELMGHVLQASQRK
jgi:hypothetical protein